MIAALITDVCAGSMTRKRRYPPAAFASITFVRFPPRHYLADLATVVRDFGPGSTPEQRQLRLRLAESRARLRQFDL